MVRDALDAEVERLEKVGHRPLETSFGKFEIAIFEDPDGNRIVLAQPA
jgi:hypothetical protein